MPATAFPSARPFLLALILVPLLLGCSRQPADVREVVARTPRILLVGVDGLEWDVLLPLVKAGRLPNLARMMTVGRFGFLRSFAPTESPAIWTSVATGKTPARHGVLSFTRPGPDGGRPVLYGSRDRRTKAIWNIVGDFGRRACVVGWWATYPVEPLNGVMVAQTNTDAQVARGNLKGSLMDGVARQVYPPEREDAVLEVAQDAAEGLPERARRAFGELEAPGDSRLVQSLLRSSAWAFRADAIYEKVTKHLAGTDGPFDLTMVYFGGPDVVGHRFWRYRAPDLYDNRPATDEVESFGDFIDDYYAYVDGAIRRLRDTLPKDVTVLVVSDHGMKPGNLDAEFGPNSPPMRSNSALHEDAPAGVFLAAGPLVAPPPAPPALAELTRARIDTVGSVLDITPTILHLMALPVGRDMEGRVLRNGFTGPTNAADPVFVETHDSAGFLAARGLEGVVDEPGVEQRLEQLRGLGYID